MENEHNSGAFKGAVVTILLLLLVCAGIATYKYVTGTPVTFNYNSTEESVTEQIPTVEEAMIDWEDTKEGDRCYEVYSNLPPTIMQALFEKLGTQEPVRKYVYEYERNREYYISLQIIKQLKEQGLNDSGVDGDRIDRVEIKTKLKNLPKENKTPIPAVAGDSIS